MSTATDGLITQQQRYIALRKVIEDKEADLKHWREEADKLQANLAEEMVSIGQTHTVVDGMRLTVRTTPRIGKRGDVTMETLVGVLENHADLAYLVKPGVHAGQLQAALKEVLEEQGELPHDLEVCVRRWDQTVVAVGKA